MLRRLVKWCLSRILFLVYRNSVKGEGVRPTINGLCKFGARVVVGSNCHFNGIRTFGAGTVHIGDNFHSAIGLRILTQSHNYRGELIPYDHEVIVKDVWIGDNVWVGMDVLILPGVRIGEGAIIQAGSVVSMSIPDLAIAGGNPAKMIKYRDAEHYRERKLAGRIL